MKKDSRRLSEPGGEAKWMKVVNGYKLPVVKEMSWG